MALVTASLIAAEQSWDPADAAKEAEADIRSGHIKFYWAGTIAAGPVDVPMDVAQRYPKGNAGIGCVVPDMAFRKRQEAYARRYNHIMLAYVRSHQ